MAFCRMWLDISAFYRQAVYTHPMKEMMRGHNNNNNKLICSLQQAVAYTEVYLLQCLNVLQHLGNQDIAA